MSAGSCSPLYPTHHCAQAVVGTAAYLSLGRIAEGGYGTLEFLRFLLVTQLGAGVAAFLAILVAYYIAYAATQGEDVGTSL